jgi:Transglutaminase-like superfamily
MDATHTEPTTRLRLADHMRACLVDGQVVLLDLERGRYFALKGPACRVVASVLAPSGNAMPALASEDSVLVEPLLRNHILTTAPLSGGMRLPQLPSADAATASQQQVPDASIRGRDLLRFLFAVTVAAFWLRWRSLDSIAAAVRDLQHQRKHSTEEALRLRHAVTVFDRLRPLTFTSRDQCLFDSLALAIFLGRQGLRASWVIGVSIRPFKAHSWIQDGSEVLNDVAENVRRFTPILVV